MRLLVVLALSCLALAGCNRKQKSCEHARDALVAMLTKERPSGDAPEPMRATFEKLRAQQAQIVEANFVKRCLESNDEQMRCIVRIDELLETLEDAREEVDACIAVGGPEVQDCIDAAQGATMGECYGILDELLKEIMREGWDAE